jgi:sugar lactone lactonase YvrE
MKTNNLTTMKTLKWNSPMTFIMAASMMVYSCGKSSTKPTPPVTTTTVTVTTLAGSGTAGFTNGTGTAASFNGVWSVGADASGNVFVADQANQVIRKVTSGGVVTTFAGSVAGYLDGTGTAAEFDNPHELALDNAGNIYVVDQSNQMIREITPAGVVTTFAGSGLQGFQDGPAATATFSFPSGVAVDGSGNVYVADYQNNAIRKISGGVVSTLAGGTQGSADGTGTAAQFNQPDDIAIDNTGNLYVTDWANHEIRKVTPAGVVTTFAGNGTGGFANGKGTAAIFNHPWGIAIDSKNNIYVGDEYNNMIRKITSDGTVTTLAGSGTQGLKDGSGTAASFNAPLGVAVNAAGSIVYVADWQNNVVRVITIK